MDKSGTDKMLNNFKVVNREIDTVQESVKKKFLLNKSYLTFLLDLQNSTLDRFHNTVRSSQVPKQPSS